MKLSDIPETCICGKAMHLTESQKVMIKQWGHKWPKEKEVRILGGGRYLVPAYYIILHGLKASTIDQAGFTKI